MATRSKSTKAKKVRVPSPPGEATPRTGKRTQHQGIPLATDLSRVDLPAELFEQNSADKTAGPAFARHETFAPRSGWLRKGFLAAAKNENIFLSETAHLDLGVGKNMSRAIRFWCHATGLLEDVALPSGRSYASRPTSFGLQLMGPNGWDEYTEDPASLWLLHWRLVRNSTLATAWHYAFTVFAEQAFDSASLALSLSRYAAREFPTSETAESSIHKDVSCLIRMYSADATSQAVTDETIQSPFTDLGILSPVGGRSGSKAVYRFETGAKIGLPAEVVAAACLEFAATVAPGAQTVSLARLLVDPSSPGMAFKLSEGVLASYIEEAGVRHPELSLGDSGGLVQLGFNGRARDIAFAILDDYFRRRSTEAA